MPTPPFEWIAGFAVLMTILAITCWRQGPYRAVGAVVAASFVFPVWVKYEIAGLPFDLRTASAIVGLSLFCVHPAAKLFTNLTLLDILMVVLLGITTASDALNGMPIAIAALRSYGEWGLPYFAGRYALKSREDLEFLAPVVVGVGTLLALGGIVETVTNLNVFELIFGVRPIDGAQRNMLRFGWRRAYAVARHPNYFGGMLLLLLPWFAELWASARTTATRLLAVAGSCLLGAGTLSTLSRGAFLVFLSIPLFSVAFWSRKILIAMGILFAIGVAAAVWRFNDVNRFVHQLGNEKTTSSRTVIVNGETVAYTSTSTHLRVFQLYGPIIGRVGPLGAGTEATAKFPPNVPGLPKSAKTVRMIPMVDNGFILLGLRFGWMGLTVFVVVVLTAIWQFLSLKRVEGVRFFATSMAGVSAAYCVFLFTVWMSYDFGFVYLWTIGLSSGLQCSVLTGDIRRSQRSLSPHR